MTQLSPRGTHFPANQRRPFSGWPIGVERSELSTFKFEFRTSFNFFHLEREKLEKYRKNMSEARKALHKFSSKKDDKANQRRNVNVQVIMFHFLPFCQIFEFLSSMKF